MLDNYAQHTTERLVQRYKRVQAARSRSDWEATAEDIERYVRPISGSFFQSYENEGGNDFDAGADVYNSTAIIAADSLAASIQSYLVNPSDKWFESKYRIEKLNRNDEAKEWLEISDLAVYQSLTQSNFDIKGAEFFLDLVTYGTGAVTEEVASELAWAGIDFSTIPVRDLFFELDTAGNMVYLYRRFMWTALQIYDRFGDDGTPMRIKHDAIEGINVGDRHEVVFCVWPRRDKPDTGELKAPKERPWGYSFILINGSERLGEEGGYHEMPAFLARWKSTSTSQWGKSPAHDVLGDIRNVNYWCRMHREAAAKIVDPAVLVQDRGVLSNLDLRPGGVTVVRKIEDVSPFESRADFAVSYEEIREMEENINQAFMQDRLALKESPAMTATEVNARREFMMRAITQPLAILQRNFLDPLIRRTYRILYRAGRLPDPPDIVVDSGAETDIHYTGPLPRQQKTHVANAEIGMLQLAGEMAQMMPGILDVLDTDKMVRNIAMNMGVPALDLRSEEEIAEVRKQREAEAARQRKIMEMQAAGQGMESMARGAAAVRDVPETAAALNEMQ